jgi:hypothetical protein
MKAKIFIGQKMHGVIMMQTKPLFIISKQKRTMVEKRTLALNLKHI